MCAKRTEKPERIPFLVPGSPCCCVQVLPLVRQVVPDRSLFVAGPTESTLPRKSRVAGEVL
jgi:hypothetical protein